MGADRSIIVVSRQPATVSAVSAALEMNGRFAQENVCVDLGALAPRLADGLTDAVLIDLDAQPSKMLSAMDPMVRKYPETRFIVLSNQMDPRLMLEAMQAGARHFMTKQELAGNLSSVLRRLCANASQTVGKTISFFSASGGCGATTLAVNLAWELQAESGLSALIMDLDFAYGGAGAYLGTEGTYGVRELQQRSGSIDPELISTSATVYAEQLKVLVSASSANLGSLGSYERLGEIISAGAQSCAHVVIDAPRMPPEVAAETAKVSTENFLVMQLTVKDVRVARGILAAMDARGVSPETVKVLVNRYRKRGAILELDAVKEALPGATIECLSNDFQPASESLNFGKPLAQAAPRSVLRRELQQMAKRILGMVPAVNGVH